MWRIGSICVEGDRRASIPAWKGGGGTVTWSPALLNGNRLCLLTNVLLGYLGVLLWDVARGLFAALFYLSLDRRGLLVIFVKRVDLGAVRDNSFLYGERLLFLGGELLVAEACYLVRVAGHYTGVLSYRGSGCL